MTETFYPEIPILRRAKIGLASSSPRRRELLARLVPAGQFEVIAANIDESRLPGENPEAYVKRLALEKAEAGAKRWLEIETNPTGPKTQERVIIGADTTVVVNGQVLGKPASQNEAAQMLQQLSGRTHTVMTGIATVQLIGESLTHSESRVISTEVGFKPLSRAEIEWYVATGEPMDKAGAYAIQGYGGTFIKAIQGDYYNVVGLPLVPLIELLKIF